MVLKGFTTLLTLLKSNIYQNETKSDIFEDLDILHKYFINLKCVDLITYDCLPLTEVCEILSNFKLNFCIFEGPNYDDEYRIKSLYAVKIADASSSM